MTLSEALLPEFDSETAKTRKTLERVPEDKFGWKPHEKSGTMGWLATHLAMLPVWAVTTIQQDSIDIAPVDGPTFKVPTASSPQEVLTLFDQNSAQARAAIAAATDDDLVKPWTLLQGGKTIFTMPKMTVLRGFVINHTIHNRAQLGVYLRLNNIPVPGHYGASADE